MGTYNLVCNSGVVKEGEKVVLMIGFENHKSIGFNVDMISLPVRCVYLGYGNFKVEKDDINFVFFLNSLKENFDFTPPKEHLLNAFEISTNELSKIVYNCDRFNKKDFKVVVFHESYFEAIKSIEFEDIFKKINCFSKTKQEFFEILKTDELTENDVILKKIKADFVWYSLQENISSFLGIDYLRKKIKELREFYLNEVFFDSRKLIGFLEIAHFNSFFSESGLVMVGFKIVNDSERVFLINNLHHSFCLCKSISDD